MGMLRQHIAHRGDRFSHFKGYIPGAVRTFPTLCSVDFITFKVTAPLSPAPSPWHPRVHFLSVDLPALDIPQKRNRTLGGLPCLASLSWRIVSKGRACGSTWRCFFPFPTA